MFVRASNDHLTMHLVYVEAIGIDCQPIFNVVGIGTATAAIEGEMIGGMLGEAPVANEMFRQPIVTRVDPDREDGKRWRGE
jgi:hypothetical protein